MQSVAEIANKVQSQSLIGTPTQQKSFNSSDEEFNSFINRIFSAIAAQFPAWASNHLSNDEKRLATKRLWRYALKDLTTNHISNGIKNMIRECEFPPVPATFRRLCFKIEGLPELDQAFNQALSGLHRHPVIKAAARETGNYDLRRGVTNDTGLKRRFEINYNEMAKRWINGESLEKAVAKRIENTSNTFTVSRNDALIDEAIRFMG